MTDAAFASVIDLAAGALVLAAVLVVWRRDLRSIIRLLAWQGVALAAIPSSAAYRNTTQYSCWSVPPSPSCAPSCCHGC